MPTSSRPAEVAVVQMVFVAPERWGEDTGDKLFAAALAEVRVCGFERVQLWTHADDERVRRLYEGHGFGRTGPRMAGESGEPIVLYFTCKRKEKRRGWDSNPRDGSTPPTRFPVALLRPTRTPLLKTPPDEFIKQSTVSGHHTGRR